MHKRPTYLAQGRAQTNLGKEKDMAEESTTKLDEGDRTEARTPPRTRALRAAPRANRSPQPKAKAARTAFDYQSECHCSKTLIAHMRDGNQFDYQSECHCSKTFVLFRVWSPLV